MATLVVFRILYFLIPFGTAVSIMGTRELWLNVMVPWQERRRLMRPCGAHRRAAACEETEVAIERPHRQAVLRQLRPTVFRILAFLLAFRPQP